MLTSALPLLYIHDVLSRWFVDGADDCACDCELDHSADDPAAKLAGFVQDFPIPKRLRDVGLDKARIPEVAKQAAALGIKAPRPVSADDAAALLTAAL